MYTNEVCLELSSFKLASPLRAMDDGAVASLVARVTPVPALTLAETFSIQRGVQQAAVEHLASGFFGREAVLGELSEARISASSALYSCA